jgi:hypothetical protein
MSIYPAGSTSEVDLLLNLSILQNGPIVHFWWLVDSLGGGACMAAVLVAMKASLCGVV